MAQDPLSLPWNPESTTFPLRKDLPSHPGHPPEAAWVWGKDDFAGRLNLLTPARVKAAASEIRTGELARVDLPLNVPREPAFARASFLHTIKQWRPGVAYDDEITFNTQSSTQWDGFRHFAHIASGTFYNNTKDEDIIQGPNATDRCSIHYWSEHGFSGRGVLLDYRAYTDAQGIPRHDNTAAYAISYDDLVACGKYQGLDIRPEAQGGDIKIGDVLFIRAGWTQDYNERNAAENKALSARAPNQRTSAGVKQEPAILDWLHDCYFAAVAGDAPGFQRWPSPERYLLHEYIIALWGMPLGELLDLEKMSRLAQKNRRWTFFFSSSPLNTPGGVASPVNGTAIF
ncbi:uncharacterized protein Z520_11475 [Fonsecaea multimorphosa CBS 102226]|uniref:Cyclase n=1 Tax=Fonsecaea multimorphosa CBS 102226 TaxID=1442371 RepID=A0A0D2JHZ8_9EURO|nr:uncharacterized protein Z520_11475 [Fonsecaea multimorphosa CBS 102226]KIX92812.1 hypothetical protein Z520_11475 [Fonsecaea multimorphosa CBS 102226]OAL18061.1 hypothetical protein AYO22_10983 [Fonsecaea multimorphosa]